MSNFFVDEYAKLIGKTVAKVAASSDGEFYGLIFSDGTTAWILCDPEGNGPGFLDIEIPKKGRR